MPARDTRAAISVGRIAAFVGGPAAPPHLARRRRPEMWTNPDDEVNRQEIVVRPGLHGAPVDQGATGVASAIVQNAETSFIFAVDTGPLHLDDGERVLRATAAILGGGPSSTLSGAGSSTARR